MIKLVVVVAGIGFAAYWFFMRPDCGRSGAVACPPAALEEGIGVELARAEVCPSAGYLCAGRGAFRIERFPLDKGKLRVRVPLPEFADKESARELQDAAIEGIMAWDGHPFPIVIYKGNFPIWDVGVVWSQGLYMEGAAGVANHSAMADGKRIKWSIGGLGVVVPSTTGGMPPEIAAMLAAKGVELPGATSGDVLSRVRAVASHEMGHALGVMHSDRPSDVMYPQLPRDTKNYGVTARDLQTVDALYALPNGAMVQ